MSEPLSGSRVRFCQTKSPARIANPTPTKAKEIANVRCQEATATGGSLAVGVGDGSFVVPNTSASVGKGVAVGVVRLVGVGVFVTEDPVGANVAAVVGVGVLVGVAVAKVPLVSVGVGVLVGVEIWVGVGVSVGVGVAVGAVSRHRVEDLVGV